jgi:hypothetical protein
MGEIQPKLLIGAIIVLLITFFGDTIAEKLMEQLVAEFQLTPEKQSVLLSCGLLLLCSIIGIWSLNRCTAAWLLPIMLLLSGVAAVFFFGYIPTLFGTERESRHLAMTRIKLLMFAAGVILAETLPAASFVMPASAASQLDGNSIRARQLHALAALLNSSIKYCRSYCFLIKKLCAGKKN